MRKHRNAQDLSGRRFCNLTVLCRAENEIKVVHGKVSQRSRWHCLCDCGNATSVVGSNLRTGHTTSCGCRKGGKATHGMSKSRQYGVWRAMVQRCTNPKKEHYKDYGGRGITVCERWLHSFEQFLLDMGHCPNGMTLDRRDVDGNYEPNNCAWASHQEQNNNRRNNKLITWHGKSQTARKWVNELNISVSVDAVRIRSNAGMPVEKVLSTADLRTT